VALDRRRPAALTTSVSPLRSKEQAASVWQHAATCKVNT
jgi:hypothetical protein